MLSFLLNTLLAIFSIIGIVIAFWVVILTTLFVYFGYNILAELLGWKKFDPFHKEDDRYE